jgi:hypothetical protein
MHALDVTEVVDGGKNHVGLALKARSGHQVSEGRPALGQLGASNRLGRGFNSGLTSETQAVQNRGPNALFLEFSDSFFHVVLGSRDLHFDVTGKDTNNGFSHVSH